MRPRLVVSACHSGEASACFAFAQAHWLCDLVNGVFYRPLVSPMDQVLLFVVGRQQSSPSPDYTVSLAGQTCSIAYGSNNKTPSSKELRMLCASVLIKAEYNE